LRHMVGNRPVLLVCDNAFHQEPTSDRSSTYFDTYFDQAWAIYFLRRVNLKVPEYFGIFEAFDPYMQRAKSVTEPVAFVLANGPIEGAIWKNERFSLFELAAEAKVIAVRAPNGLEHVNGKPFVWLGNSPTRFLIVSRIAQTANFLAWESQTGPSRPEENDRQIRISIGSKVWQAGLSGALSLQVPLKPGLNFLDIAYQDSSTVSAQANGDTKAVPLGLWDCRISNKEGGSN